MSIGRGDIGRFAQLLQINEAVTKNAEQIFKLAAMHNFIQGRRANIVAAVCLYSAVRKEPKCRVMLMDFADILQVSVAGIFPSHRC